MEPVKYLADNCRYFWTVREPAPWSGRTASGYGKRLPCPYSVQVEDKGPWYRVYAICYGNAASLYVVRKGEMYFLRDCDFPEPGQDSIRAVK